MDPEVLVLGGGRMGQIIAEDLAEGYLVTIADSRDIDTTLKCIKADLSDKNTLNELAEQFDFIVGALPAELSFAAVKAAIAAGTDIVDVSYMKQDPMRLHDAAYENKVTVMVDVGVAPGLTNLIAGRIIGEQGYIESGKLMVGGMAADKSMPYGYRVTWSPDDLLSEYTRKARYIRDGLIVSADPLTSIEKVAVSGVGVLEAFVTDGLRTLLDMDNVKNLVEKTIRWPGHIEAIRPLLSNNTFVQEIKKQCSFGDDMVVLYCEIDGRIFEMVAYPENGLTAMQRTTALTCATFAKMVLECGSLPYGVLTPEEIGKDMGLYGFITCSLSDYGLEIEERDG